jgi:hypothetical protein
MKEKLKVNIITLFVLFLLVLLTLFIINEYPRFRAKICINKINNTYFKKEVNKNKALYERCLKFSKKEDKDEKITKTYVVFGGGTATYEEYKYEYEHDNCEFPLKMEKVEKKQIPKIYKYSNSYNNKIYECKNKYK